MKNVLFTSVSRRVELLREFRGAYAAPDLSAVIVAIDTAFHEACRCDSTHGRC